MDCLLTKNALGIFWEGKGPEVDGCLAYGYWGQPNVPEPVFPIEIWPKGTEHYPWKLFGQSWIVWMWNIRVSHWPSQERWNAVIAETLESLRCRGAEIAWFGTEGHFCDPPCLFDPNYMSGGVWAALGKKDIMHGPPALDNEFVVLSDDVFIELRKDTSLVQAR